MARCSFQEVPLGPAYCEDTGRVEDVGGKFELLTARLLRPPFHHQPLGFKHLQMIAHRPAVRILMPKKISQTMQRWRRRDPASRFQLQREHLADVGQELHQQFWRLRYAFASHNVEQAHPLVSNHGAWQRRRLAGRQEPLFVSVECIRLFLSVCSAASAIPRRQVRRQLQTFPSRSGN
jgi:hypothetical protein